MKNPIEEIGYEKEKNIFLIKEIDEKQTAKEIYTKILNDDNFSILKKSIIIKDDYIYAVRYFNNRLFQRREQSFSGFDFEEIQAISEYLKKEK